MKKVISGFWSICLVFLLVATSNAQSKIKIACVGNSITEGAGLKKPYPVVLQELLGEAVEVKNFGLGGRTLLKKGNRPYWNEDTYKEAMAWNPDVVIIKLGTNDSKPENWKFKNEFEPDYIAFVNSFKTLSSKPKIYLVLPLPAFESKWGITEGIIKNEIIPSVKTVAKQTKVKTIDLYTPFLGKANLTYDGIHPNDEGAFLLANEVYKALPKKLKKKKKRSNG